MTQSTKQGKAKFRKGQVVCVDGKLYLAIVRCAADDGPQYDPNWYDFSDGYSRHGSRARALTAREKGSQR